MRICYVSLNQTTPTRDAVYLNGLRELGVEIISCIPPSTSAKKWWDMFWSIRRTAPLADLVFVGYSGHLLTILARIATRKPIVFNALSSLYEGRILSRGQYGFARIRAICTWFIDAAAFNLATLTLVETRHQLEWVRKKFFVPRHRLARLWTGADEDVFRYNPSVQKLPHFTVLFRGAFLPESGIQHVIEAADLLRDTGIQFRVIGSGMMRPTVERMMANKDFSHVEWIQQRLGPDALPRMMQECHISLGQLADHERLRRTIPHKAFESLALQLPYLTARTPGVMELLTEGESCACCLPGNAEDLARAILSLRDSNPLREHIAQQGYALFQKRLRRSILAQEFLALLP